MDDELKNICIDFIKKSKDDYVINQNYEMAQSLRHIERKIIYQHEIPYSTGDLLKDLIAFKNDINTSKHLLNLISYIRGEKIDSLLS